MRLTCFKLSETPLKVVPAAARRDWMDQVPDRHIYRCLPIAIANTHGWEILCREGFSVSWDGRVQTEGMVVTPDGPGPACAKSHFSSGILTFDIGMLFRTEPDWNLMVTGPINTIKDGIVPLTGIVETDWLPYPFTMNWRFTRRNIEVRFEKDEPIAHIMPVPKGAISDTEPVFDDMTKYPELVEQYTGWQERRREFMERFDRHEQSALTEKWQKLYHKGTLPDGTEIDGHTNKLRAKPFQELEPAPEAEPTPAAVAPKFAPTQEAKELPDAGPRLAMRATTDSSVPFRITKKKKPGKQPA